MLNLSSLLIVGIDPGITTGLAVLDLAGNLVLIKSKKALTDAKLVRDVRDLGSPVIVACDRRPAPKKVSKIAGMFQARLIYPYENPSKLKKAKLVRWYFKRLRREGQTDILKRHWLQHEKDALAAALHAWKIVRSLIIRIDLKLKPYKSRPNFADLEQHVKTQVLVKKQNINKSIEQFMKR